MKKMICFVVIVCIFMALCACGTSNEKAAPEGMESTLPGQNLSQGAASAETGASKVEDDDVDYDALAETAKKLYQKNVSEMYQRLGDPISEQKSPSCLGKGEDGVYTYNNIVIYTYSEGSENIIGVSVVDNNGEELYSIPEN